MARIRTIKPEIWTDEKFGPLDPLTKLVFIGLISQADDGGRILDSVRLIDGLLFAYDDSTSVRRSLDELSRTGLIRRGVTKTGQRVVQISNWDAHQKIDRPNMEAALPEIVKPDKGHGPFDEGSSKDRRSLDEDSSSGSTTNDLLPTTDDQRSKPPREATEVSEDFSESDGSDWIHPTDRLSGSQVLHAWIEHQPGPVPSPERKRQRRFARKLAGSHTAEEVAAAFIGMTQLFPHCPPKSEPWDLEDLDRKFAKALAKARDHPEIRDADFDREFNELTQQMEAQG